MRLGLALYGGLDRQSGGFRYDRRLVDELRVAGDAVDVIDLPWRSYPRGLLDNLFGSLLEDLEGDYDVLLQDELAHTSLVRANRRLSCPVVSVVHHLRADEGGRLAPVYEAVERRYLATVDAAICNSEATRTAVLEASPLSAEQTLVAPPAGDRFDPAIDEAAIDARARGGPLQVVFLGNIEPRKGLDTLIDGLSMVEDPWELTVVGRVTDPGYRRRVEQRIANTDREDCVTFTGRLADERLAAVLREGHVLALPSRHEGFGIAYLEGMSFGLPAIATTAGGADAVVSDGETGHLVDPEDPDAVAEAVSRLATDRDQVARMGVAARRRYASHPSWPETTERVRSFLADVGGARRPEVA